MNLRPCIFKASNYTAGTQTDKHCIYCQLEQCNEYLTAYIILESNFSQIPAETDLKWPQKELTEIKQNFITLLLKSIWTKCYLA